MKLTLFQRNLVLSDWGHLFLLFLFFNSSTLYSQHKDIEKLEDEIEATLRSKNQKNKDSIHADLLITLGRRYLYINLDSLLIHSTKALEISRHNDYDELESKALMGIALYHSGSGRHKKAIAILKKVKTILDNTTNNDLKVILWKYLGWENTYIGDYGSALESYLKGLDIANRAKKKNIYEISNINENIAQLYIEQEEYQTALLFYEKVKKINTNIDNKDYNAQTLSNLANLYTQINDYGNATFNINQAIGVFEENKNHEWLSYSYLIKGNIYLKQKKYKWAIYWYGQSEMIHKKLDDQRAKADIFCGLAASYLGIGSDSLSQAYAIRAYNISIKINALHGHKQSSEILYKIYKKQKDYKRALSYHEIFQKTTDSLEREENQKSLVLLKTKLNYDQQKKDLMATNEKKLAKQRSFIYVSVIVLTILLATLIPLYINQKKLKKLNRKLKESTNKLEQRQTELNEINNTKDKLFSIIGHDLKGPIGALQSVLKLFTSKEIGEEDFLGFVPKLKTDVDYTLFTLNNLLTWGYSQMNGTKTRPKVTSLSILVDNSVNLLSEVAASKSIKIVKRLPENLSCYVDEDQIDLVIRNLISNAIKFTPKNGLITVGAQADENYWKVIVNDTGVGMDDRTIAELFSDNTNTTTYGTNNEKGTGLGLSLCREMITNNRGKIWVESTPKKGSTFYFTLPKVQKKYKKAG
ncbi:tetratricopeptide repeat-containing sensor histidine kinase [uncultured Croceitalea sp.]|uniref:tetratricopeptide repeat-containing sensor histidine kinase n=1 Tax=uncultured Croceitalea sp. TaxID=1798908 RepID=UPI0033055C97